MRPSRIAAAILVLVLLAACTPAASPTPSVTLRPVKLLLGFQPDVQFAPFYLAQQQSLYANAGLDVTIEYKSDADLVRLVGSGQAEFGVTDATDVMISRTAGIPIKYVATLYRQFPVALIGPKGTVPATPAELAGRRIGTPGKYGSSWHALLALLDAGGLTGDGVTIREYPQFNQVDGLLHGDVDFITGYRNNEPLRLAAQGMQTDMLTVEQIAPLPGPGLVVGDGLLAADPVLVQSFVNATIAAMTPIAADPQLGVEAAVVAVPSIASDRATALAVLTATVALWKLPDGGLSPIVDKEVWMKGYETMKRLGFIDGSVPLSEMATLDLSAEPSPTAIATFTGPTPGPSAAAPGGASYIRGLAIRDVVDAARTSGLACRSLSGNAPDNPTLYEVLCTADDHGAGFSYYLEAYYWTADRVAAVTLGAQLLGNTQDPSKAHSVFGTVLGVAFSDSDRQAAVSWLTSKVDDRACTPCLQAYGEVQIAVEGSGVPALGSITLNSPSAAP